ncbi:hypothetical protein IW140_006337 [Coemansia sp. RSA 1813]|nr:hypothetical protein LPJ74_006148 [Coemansia sp. RSA 1843]KAJ2085505.1 hypothetical protein IW138_006288 [Coemansia sp. RSA 986]KAJ2562740.1 hypothetical protein IW140_006337 [Coemansia sp. RSA 1813]
MQTFTYTSEITGADIVTKTTTGNNGSVAKETSTSSYTSYFIYMNDLKSESTFVGIPVSTTDGDGDPSTYMSLEPYVPSKSKTTPTSSTRTSPTATNPSQSDDANTSEPSASEAETNSTGAGDHSSKTNIGPIVGGVVGGVVVLILLAIGGWFYKRKHDRKKHLEEHQKEEMQLLAMELDGSYNPKGTDKNGNGGMSDFNLYANPDANASFTDDLASKYTGGSLSRNLPSLREAYSTGAQHINVGTEITMDSHGRMGMPDGSPLIIDSILPLRNVKAADNYTDLEWFPLVTNEKELMQHSGPSYIEEKELSHVATYIQKPGAQKGISPIVRMQRRP